MSEESSKERAKAGPDGHAKRALVLAGGGIPGWMYEVGCLAALDDFFDGFAVNDFDIFVGISAGSATAALLANQVKPILIYDDIQNDRETPFNFVPRDIYGFGYQETFYIIKKFSRSIYPIARYYFKSHRRISVLDLFQMLQENLPSGILTLKNLDRHLSGVLSREGYFNDFRMLKSELFIPAVNVDLGRYDVFGEKPFDDIPISQAVIASSAMPILFQPVHIRGSDYIDGGVGRVAYLDIALNHGAELICTINPVQYIMNDRVQVCIPSLSGKCVGIKDKGLSYIYDQAMRINTSTRLYLGMKRYRSENPKNDFLLFQPKPSEAIMFSQNIVSFDTRVEILRYGYHSTAKILKDNYEYYRNTFNRHHIRVSIDGLKEP